MTCKDCVHYEVCRHFVDLINPLLADHNRIDINENTDICKEHFQDRSRFVELPCKVGDIGYALYRRYSKHGKANPIIKSGRISGMRFNLNMELIVTVHRIATGIVGKTVFLTKEEAEQALKEREENEN